jgi:DNA-binding response OmpR family regulator
MAQDQRVSMNATLVKPFRILVVEDEETVCRLLSRALAPPRFNVIQAHTIDDARRLLVPPPSLVILDVLVGGESGEDFCHSIHLDPLTRHVPILIMTGRDVPDLNDSTLAACAEELVRKPFDIAELIFHVETLLKKAAYDLRHFPDAYSTGDKV